jgi:hypothetical protein
MTENTSTISRLLDNRPYLVSGITGLLVIAFAIWLYVVFPAQAPYMPKGFSTPIIYFEFIQSPIEVDAFFGITEHGKADETFVNQMDKGNHLDFIFMVLYSVFLFLFFRQLRIESGKKWLFAGMILSPIALFTDFMENIQLLGITANLESGNFHNQLVHLKIYTWMKWASLAVIFAFFSAIHLKARFTFKFMAYVAATPLLLGILAFLKPGIATEFFTKTVSLSFFMLIAYSFLYKRNPNPS